MYEQCFTHTGNRFTSRNIVLNGSNLYGLVMFDQDSLHAGCPPLYSNKRLVINFNIKLL